MVFLLDAAAAAIGAYAGFRLCRRWPTMVWLVLPAVGAIPALGLYGFGVPGRPAFHLWSWAVLTLLAAALLMVPVVCTLLGYWRGRGGQGIARADEVIE